MELKFVLYFSSYEVLIPKNSFIHVDDYGSIEKLAEKINYYLDDENHDEYMKFFDWWSPEFKSENNYRLKTIEEYRNHGWCKLCKDLMNADNKQLDYPAKKEIQTWWYGKGSENPPDHRFSRIIGEDVCLKVRENPYVLPDGTGNNE